MRKVIIALVLCFLSAFIFSACNNGVFSDNIPNNVSYVETRIFWGQGDRYFAEITLGRRENPLNANGKSQNVTDFFEIKIIPLKAVTGDNLNIALSNDDGFNMTCQAKQSVTENEFIYETYDKVKFNSLEFVTVGEGTGQEIVELTDMTKDNINWEKAYEIAQNEFKDRIEADGGKREIFIKLTRERIRLGGECYWYICYVGEMNDFWSLLLNAENGKIISRK